MINVPNNAMDYINSCAKPDTIGNDYTIVELSEFNDFLSGVESLTVFGSHVAAAKYAIYQAHEYADMSDDEINEVMRDSMYESYPGEHIRGPEDVFEPHMPTDSGLVY